MAAQDKTAPEGKFDPLADPLTGEEGRKASQALTVNFPRIVRSTDDPPVGGQEQFMISFNLFDPPKKTSAGEPILGFFKVRGCGSESQMRLMAAKTIKEVDSVNKIHIGHTGRWHPLTHDPRFTGETVDVHSEEEEKMFQETARKAVQQKHVQKRRELQEEAKIAEENRKSVEDTTTLEYYTLRRVAEIDLSKNIVAREKEIEEQKRGLQVAIDLLAERHKEILELEGAHPEYQSRWLEVYNLERKRSGVPPFSPIEGQFAALDEKRKVVEAVADCQIVNAQNSGATTEK